MELENLNIKEIMESRRRAVEASLRTISAEELKTLADKIFPYFDHPWRELFLKIADDPGSGTFYHGVTDDRIQVFYCHNKGIGMWLGEGFSKGPLQPEELVIMKEIVGVKA